MGDTMLSQEEINALINSDDSTSTSDSSPLSLNEIDTIGEVANISMGTAATTLFSLVNKKVEISTPVVSIATWDEISSLYETPCVLIKISYTKGLDGSNLLVLKEHDVKVITDLMMSGDGTNVDGEIGEIHLSAISEAMNQMMGSSATSLSAMLNEVVDISPPTSDLVDFKESSDAGDVKDYLGGIFVKIEFRLQIADLVDSIIMQLYPIDLAKEMCHSITKNMESDSNSTVEDTAFEDQSLATAQDDFPPMEPNPLEMQSPLPQMQQQMQQQMDMSQMMGQQPMMGQPMMQQQMNVQPAQFTPFSGSFPMQYSPENIDLIMDVPLEVTVELGRTHKSIQDILDFAPGTIIELNKIAGEPIDVLVNGKYVAKGEVVVIEEAFGIRITEIMK